MLISRSRPISRTFSSFNYKAKAKHLSSLSTLSTKKWKISLPKNDIQQNRSYSYTKDSSKNEKETIVKLLYNIGSRKEVEQYLRHFSSVESQNLQ